LEPGGFEKNRLFFWDVKYMRARVFVEKLIVRYGTTDIPRGVHHTIRYGTTGLGTTLKTKVHGRQQNHQGTDQANDGKVKFVLFEMFFFLDKKGVTRDRKHGQDERENNQT